MHFRFGDIALTNTYRPGAISLLYNTNNEGEHEYAQFGITGITSIGIDYFPIRWLGVYCESSWTITNILLNKQELLNSNWQKIGAFNNRYGYTTKGLSLGIKFTL